jgi:hypothetical protein
VDGHVGVVAFVFNLPIRAVGVGLVFVSCSLVFSAPDQLLWVYSIVKTVNMHALSTLLVVAAPVLVAAQNCPLQFDGRIPKAAKLGLLDTAKSPFNADYVKGAGEF